jgi:hypothetical protein
MEGHDVERTDDRAHRAANASRRVDQDEVPNRVAADRARWTDALAGSRIAVAALVWKGCRRYGAGFDVHPLSRERPFVKGPREISAGRMLNGAGYFALKTANAPFRVNEHGLHRYHLR